MDIETARPSVPVVVWNRLYMWVFVFAGYFLGAKLGLYIYFTFHTSPALIWPPAGIGIAAVILGGYEMCIPIFVAQFLSLIVPAHSTSYATILIISIAYAAQAAIILYLLRRLKFELSFASLRNALVFAGAALVLTTIEPMVGTLTQWHSGALTVSLLYNFARAWGAGIFSTIVFAPFIIVWSHVQSYSLPPSLKHRIELIAAFASLIGVNYLLFWTPYAPIFGISVIFFLPAVLIWFALSLEPRWMTLAVFITSIQGIGGSLATQASLSTPLNVQLISDEVYIGMVAVIFMVFVAVVEERREAYARLEREYRSTSASDKAKSDFIAILAHELRNPLAPIVSSLEWLRLQPQTHETFDVLLSAQEHAGMLRRLLDDLLDTARLNQRKLKLQRENVSIQRIVEQSVVSVEDGILRRSQKLSVSLQTNDAIVYADPVRLKQILINLLTNASKYGKNGGRIGLTAETTDTEVLVRVSDDGIGIRQDALHDIFEPFKQVGSSNRRDAGLGMGLFLAKNLAEMHGGRIEVMSKGLGQGSTFSVYLPLSTRMMPADTPREYGNSLEAPGKRILVVDDNEAAANALCRLLRQYGHTTEATYSGESALDRIESFQPHLVVLDIAMPGQDGYTVARSIRASGNAVQLVALSGYGQESDKQESKTAGFDHHLVKPVNVGEILLLLRTKTELPVVV